MRLFPILIIFLTCQLFSQNALINEYYNVAGGREWTEIIVVRDGVDLRGYSLRDNSSGSQPLGRWMGEVTFRNIEFWNDLRRGTIITIIHYGVGSDDDLADGFIEISSQNNNYFDNSNREDDASLRFNQEADMIQLQTSSGSNHHTLGHSWSNGGDFVPVNGRKLCYPKSVSSNMSVQVNPGASIADFQGGYDAAENKTSAGFVNPANAQGFPNSDPNSNFWRSLREPDWSSPNLNVSVNGQNVELSWNEATDDIDNTQGYVVVRYAEEYNNIPNAELVIDSEIYRVGDDVGSRGEVIGVFSSDVTQMNHPLTDINCAINYTYAVFAYRFERDDKNRDNDPWNARGRAYNQDDHAVEILEVDKPEKAEVTSSNGTFRFCDGDQVTLYATTNSNDITFQWYQNNTIIEGETDDSLVVSQVGDYHVTVSYENGCPVPSDPIQVEIVANAFIDLRFNDERIRQDTTFYLCSGSLDFVGRGGEELIWLKDGVEFARGRDVTIEEEGIYQLRAVNGGICENESAFITVERLTDDLTFTPQIMNFGETESFTDLEIRINNQSNNSVEIIDAIFNDNYQIINPSVPFTINATSSLDVTVRFQPQTSGVFEDTLNLVTQCGTNYEIYLNGNKPVQPLGLNPSFVDFGKVLECDDEGEITINIWNPGSDPKTLISSFIENNSAEFSIIAGDINNVILESDTIQITLSYDPTTEGSHNDFLVIPFEESGISDTLKISLAGLYVIPNLIFSDENNNEINQLDFGVMSECQTSVDTSFYIQNLSDVDINVLFENDPRIQILSQIDQAISLNERVLVEIRFTPSDVQNDFNLNLNYEPCTKSTSLNILAQKPGFIITANRSEIDFGIVQSFCLSNINEQLDIAFSGSSYNNLTVSSINISNEFSINGVQVGEVFSVGQNIEITINPNTTTAGIYTSDLTIQFDPCGEITRTIQIEIEPDLIDISFDNTQFELVEPNVNYTGSIVITNNNSIEVQLLSVDDINQPFTLNATLNTFPISIPSGESREVFVDYQALNNDQQDSDNILLNFNQPCDFNKNANISGSSEPNDIIYPIEVSTDQIILGKPAERIAIPIYINSSTNQLNEIEINSATFNITFNSTLLKPFRVRASEDYDEITIDQQSSDSYSNYNFEISINDQDITWGKWLELEADVFIGNDSESPVNFEMIRFESPSNIEITSSNGLLVIDSVCLSDHMLFLHNPTVGNLFDGAAIDASFEIEYITNPNIPFEIEIFDLANIKIHESIYENRNFVKIKASELNMSNGVHIVRIKNGPFEAEYKIMYVN